jgi:hypothetical protein
MFDTYKEKYKDNVVLLNFIDKVENTFDSIIFKDNVKEIRISCVNEDEIGEPMENPTDEELYYYIGIHLKNKGYISLGLSNNKIYSIFGQHSIEYFNTENWDKVREFIYSLKKDFIFIDVKDNYYVGENDSIVINKDGITVKRDDIIYTFDKCNIDYGWNAYDLLSLIRHNYYDENGNIIYKDNSNIIPYNSI